MTTELAVSATLFEKCWAENHAFRGFYIVAGDLLDCLLSISAYFAVCFIGFDCCLVIVVGLRVHFES
jgi:hypothetical protein